jgi:hypothetical protein
LIFLNPNYCSFSKAQQVGAPTIADEDVFGHGEIIATGDASNERTCDEGVAAESRDNAITGLGLCRAPSLNHAVVVYRVGRRNFDGAKSPRHPLLARALRSL